MECGDNLCNLWTAFQEEVVELVAPKIRTLSLMTQFMAGATWSAGLVECWILSAGDDDIFGSHYLNDESP